MIRFMILFLLSTSVFSQTRSGLDYASDEIRKLQSSDAENPGMLWVDQGAALFGKECASCHRSVKGIAARYPRVEKGKIVTLEQMARHRKPGMDYESEEMLALTSYIAHESRGLPFQNSIKESDAAKGKSEYFRRRGQMNLSCSHCHDASAGKKLGEETVSQGQPNGYPAYRLEWQKIGSLHRRLRSCMF